MAAATKRWQITLNRSELPSEPSLMPEHLSLSGNEVHMISGWDSVREIRLKDSVKELAPDSLKIRRPEEWGVNPPMEVVKAEPLVGV